MGLDQLYGTGKALIMKLPKLFIWNEFDPIPEGIMAHQIKDESVRKDIAERYKKKYNPPANPCTHPEQYDPLNPPQGWAYDPYYECWINIE